MWALGTFASPWASALALGLLATVLSPFLAWWADWLPRQIDPELPPPAKLSSLSRRLCFALLCALPAAACGWRYGLSFAGLAATTFALLLATLAWIDAHTGLLPDHLTLALLWLGLLVNLNHTFAMLPDAVIGAACGYLFFWLIYQAFLLCTGREGLGYGDFKLLAALGAWLGWAALPNIVLFASVSALLITLLRRWRSGTDMGLALHYGPYLAAAGAFQLFWQF
ncbi:prepilin peptidase [Pusillimonas sp. CC-YST705]|uniref:Prepilin peptidase n=1 Tax=Mesopusillimonas faecipullorum TaxID=2755040 RepID=A0ABS8CEC8_9BURK|nr:A24 family peptidase [Mesopusillimonas faecipullorum]MCB5364391.1 prepilin peptidase [Mesopusillimonas faecipullorum]